MLRNPFTPTEIASDPADFFGREEELSVIERSLLQGSVAIQGPIGIGKSSLLARGLLAMEGFETDREAKSVLAVADRDVAAADDMARMLLHSLIQVDETQKRIKFKIGSFFEHESAEIVRNSVEGRHLSNLKTIVEKEYLKHLVNDDDRLLILAIDEADKAPVAIARLVRSVLTHTQQHGVRRVRFLLAGVSPFFQTMVDEDQGVARFFHRTISLAPMGEDEARALLESKLGQAVEWAEADGIDLRVDPRVISRVVAISGGHPHLMQLLGSHLIEHEDADPDGVIDAHDLSNSLEQICYEDRVRVYDSTLHELDVHGKLDVLQRLLALAPTGFPTRIQRHSIGKLATPDEIHWLTEHNVLTVASGDSYGLVDEFLRVRMIMDNEGDAEARVERELLILRATAADQEEFEYLEDSEDDNDG
jgi:hypothetical protein